MSLINKRMDKSQIPVLYAGFNAPIAEFDCGERCAPHNENGVPFCCDTRHAVPTAPQSEWEYLQQNSDLWREWEAQEPGETQRLQDETPEGHVLIACKGHALCQRGFRSLTCRAFPFFPYVTGQGEFAGISYYWDYEDRCWVISNLAVVTRQYREGFIKTYDRLFKLEPEEFENFKQHSEAMRKVFEREKRSIPLLHRNGEVYKVSPTSERMRSTSYDKLPKFGPYKIAAELPFPDEITVG
jgi:hypothetical protein